MAAGARAITISIDLKSCIANVTDIFSRALGAVIHAVLAGCLDSVKPLSRGAVFCSLIVRVDGTYVVIICGVCSPLAIIPAVRVLLVKVVTTFALEALPVVIAPSTVNGAIDAKFEFLNVVQAIIADIIRVIGALLLIVGGSDIAVIQTVQVVRVLADAIDDVVIATTVSLAVVFLFEEETRVALSATALRGALRAEVGTLVASLSGGVPFPAVSALDANLAVLGDLVVIAVTLTIVSQVPRPVPALGAITITVVILASRDATLEIAAAVHSSDSAPRGVSLLPRGQQRGKFGITPVTELVVFDRHLGGLEVPNEVVLVLK